MAIKLAVFDIDGTLARTEDCIPSEVAEKLRLLETRVQRIVFISGRTASYLAGLARGMGIRKPLVAGENGGVIFDPAVLWEKRLEVIRPDIITSMRETLLKEFGDLWFQPNQTMLTVSPKDLDRIDELYATVLQLKPVAENNYKLNKYCDSVEVMPKENSKGRALAVIKDLLKVKKEEIIVMGNTLVDLPMKAETGEFFIVGDAFSWDGIRNYNGIEEALDRLDNLLT